MSSKKIAFWNLDPVEQKKRMKAVLVLYGILSALCLIKLDSPYNYLLVMLLIASFGTSYIKTDKKVKLYQAQEHHSFSTKSDLIKCIVFLFGLILCLMSSQIYGMIAAVVCIIIDIAEIVILSN